MLLSELLEGVAVLSDYTDVEILDLQTDSAAKLSGVAFFCIEGKNADGHDFAEIAFRKGASAVIVQKEPKDFKELRNKNVVRVIDTREAYALVCQNFFEKRAEKLIKIGVTGTNGKTSVATLVKRLLIKGGLSCGLISTIQAEYNEKTVELCKTTPDPYQLHSLFYDMTECGIKAVSLEASSHALDQKRLFGLDFDVAIFTNLTQDHLDYHKSMIEYFEAKKKLFTMAKFAVINIDNSYGRELASCLAIPHFTCSTIDEDADFFAGKISCHKDGVAFTLRYKDILCAVRFSIPGIYSVQNALAAIAVCTALKMPIAKIVEGLSDIGGIKGRSEVLTNEKGYTVICDYAHTPDGLANILKTTRQYAKGRIILLFGCGGDRDKLKRPLMGKIASELADFSVITSDNPRTEPPNRIIGDILKGMRECKSYIVIPERRSAIRYAMDIAKRGDTVILAGKGHEQYQVLGDKKLYFDEHKLVDGITRSLP